MIWETVPLNHWLAYSQDLNNTGCFGYTGPPPSYTGGGPFAVTAAGLIELTYCGVDTGDTRWSEARQCICNHWNDGSWCNIGNLYAMYGLMKAAMTVFPPVWDFGDSLVCPPWQPVYDDTLVKEQIVENDTLGYWPAEWALPWYYEGQSRVLATVYALLILQKAAPPPPQVPGKVIIPNKVYERFGYAHWVYPDTGIYLDDACEPYQGVNPGDFFEIPIILEDMSAPIGGFELEVDYDYIDLTFYGAEPGRLLSQRWYTESQTPNPADSIFWSWEYFTYRVLPCPLCACCKYKILLYGQAEMPDGLYRRGYCLVPPLKPGST